jgi:hypothetical protein
VGKHKFQRPKCQRQNKIKEKTRLQTFEFFLFKKLNFLINLD